MGPPSLCAETASVLIPGRWASTGTAQNAWTASTWKGTPAASHRAASSATGCTVPTSLLAHITVTSATSAARSASSRSSCPGSTRPVASTSSQTSSAPSCAASHSAASDTAWCSTADRTMTVRRGSASRAARNRPSTAMLSASVPPEVRMISTGSAFRAAATASRPVSSAMRADRPPECRDAGLPPRLACSK